MKVLDPGHRYQLDIFDGQIENTLQFMKREGEGYPGNVGTSPGTNLQEVIRVLIDRTRYLDNQIHDDRNILILENLRECLWLLEERAANRHGVDLKPTYLMNVENISTCSHCGYIECGEKE